MPRVEFHEDMRVRPFAGSGESDLTGTVVGFALNGDPLVQWDNAEDGHIDVEAPSDLAAQWTDVSS